MYNRGDSVASRTRSKKARMAMSDMMMMGGTEKSVDDHGVILLKENLNVEGESGGSEKKESGSVAASCSSSGACDLKRGRLSKTGFECLGACPDEAIEIVDSDEDDDGIEAEEGLKHSEERVFQVEEERESEEGKGSFVSANEAVNISNNECGGGAEIPVILISDSDYDNSETEKEYGMAGSSSDCEGYDFLLYSSESSEDGETSDEDFRVDGDESEMSDSSCDGERGKYRKMAKGRARGRARRVESETESSGVWRSKGKRKVDEVEEEQWIGADCASATSSKSESRKKEARSVAKKQGKRVQCVNAEANQWECSGSSMPYESEAVEDKKKRGKGHRIVSLKKEAGGSSGVKKSVKNNSANDNNSDDDSVILHKGKEHHHNIGTDMRSVSILPKSQENIGDSSKVVNEEEKNKRERKYGYNRKNREKKVREEGCETGYEDEVHGVPRMASRTKNECFKYFTECFLGNNDVDQGKTQPLNSRKQVPLKWSSWEKKPIEKSESEKELDMLWAEMDMLLLAEEVGNIGTNKPSENKESQAMECKHDIIFDEQTGEFCRWCGWVKIDIKYMWPDFLDSERRGRRASSSKGNASKFDKALFNDSDDDSEATRSFNEGTVWDLIPNIKETLYPHQQEGFEFIWTNLAGTTDLANLKSVDPRSEGGCIISHAPGTGKTRLTMIFLQTYLQLFPKCLPVVVAPANILLNWEDELRKWNIGVPVHNLNCTELTGKEKANKGVDWYGNQRSNKDAIRMLKLCSWYKQKSILLISYNLFEKLAGGRCDIDEEKEKKNKMKKEKKPARIRKFIERKMGRVLLDYPGLLVLDEGHTPRNQQSCIWKVLSKSRTQKRVLLSGTPFQNNFLELYNILCLMKPSFLDDLPLDLKKFCQSKLMQGKKASKDISWELISSANSAEEKINQLKLLMNPFVHVHKGSILEKNLPGLRDCVLVLKPDGLQQETLASIECSQNGLNFEHKLALVSVHPSLFLNCSLSKKEKSVVDKVQLEKLRLNPYGGVKTKFLLEFVRLCDAVNEKVLVFSQFIDTLSLIKDQLVSAFKWSVGTEVLYMHGKLDQKQKQSLIHSFNDANSQAKVFLASIKASSEGINLIGASRVVLLDVVWNPSVERQAICRAYRLGQKKLVYTYHLLAQGTPECTKYCKQAEKNRLSELVFSNRNAEGDKLKSCGVTFEDTVLDLMVHHENLKDMFGECLVQPKERDLETLGP